MSVRPAGSPIPISPASPPPQLQVNAPVALPRAVSAPASLNAQLRGNPPPITPEAAIARMAEIEGMLELSCARMRYEIEGIERCIDPNNPEQRSLSEPLARLLNLISLREQPAPRGGCWSATKNICFACLELLVSPLSVIIKFLSSIFTSIGECCSCARSQPGLDIEASRARLNQLEDEFLDNRHRFQRELDGFTSGRLSGNRQVMEMVRRLTWLNGGYRP